MRGHAEKRIFIACFFLSFYSMYTHTNESIEKFMYSFDSYRYRRKKAYQKQPSCLSTLVTTAIKDAFLIHKNLFSFNTIVIGSIIVPAVIATHTFDNKLHTCFYERPHHKNINQVPKWTRELARVLNGPVIALLGTQAFLSRDDDFRLTSQAMLVGIPFVYQFSQLVKRPDYGEIGLRPWNEYFNKQERAHGGFPSGHLAQSAYVAILYGIRFGYKLGVPLGLLATFTGVTFLATNRHYASQLIAGVGFGAVYAAAVSAVVSSQLYEKKDIKINFSCNENGGPQLSFAYNF